MEIRRISGDRPEYPPGFRRAMPVPAAVWLRGTAPEGSLVAVVGTRRMTEYGRLSVRRLVPEIVRLGFGVVSGLALGIDGEAHAAALGAGGRTWAVIGSGLDDASIYPSAHRPLAERMIAVGGGILSEHPPGTPPLAHHFPARNRLIASLVTAVLVIEAPEKSGAMITARLALESGSDVWAVPGPIFHENARGPNRLLRDGACPIGSVDDLRFALGLPAEGETARNDRLSQLEPDLRATADLLGREPLTADEVAAHLRCAPAKAAAALARLEIVGAVRLLDGGRYTLYT